jgi:hypothetical protein
MAEQQEWLSGLLESLVEATQTQQGYSRDDLARLITLFTAFAQGVADPARAEDTATVVRVGENILQALAEVARAEKNPASSLWDEAQGCWHDAAALLSGLIAQGSVPLADAAGRLEFWIHSIGEVYCVLRLSVDPWAELTGHSADEVTRRLDQIETAVVPAWQPNRYQLYSLLARRYTQWAGFARRRGWSAEADALDYLVSRARMRSLAAYLRHGRQPVAAPVPDPDSGPHRSSPPAAPLSPLARARARLSVLGHLLVDLFYYYTAGFGYRIGRLIVINVGIVLGCGLIYWAGSLIQYADGSATVGLLQAEYFSALVFMLAALGEITPTGPLGQIVIVLQSVWGFLMISVVIATVVNRSTAPPA